MLLFRNPSADEIHHNKKILMEIEHKISKGFSDKLIISYFTHIEFSHCNDYYLSDCSSSENSFCFLFLENALYNKDKLNTSIVNGMFFSESSHH
jgi:hypothetical protein